MKQKVSGYQDTESEEETQQLPLDSSIRNSDQSLHLFYRQQPGPNCLTMQIFSVPKGLMSDDYPQAKTLSHDKIFMKSEIVNRSSALSRRVAEKTVFLQAPA